MKNAMMVFENREVEIFELDGKVFLIRGMLLSVWILPVVHCVSIWLK